jgi:hypothetical protein
MRKELGMFSVKDRVRRYRHDWLEYVERMKEILMPKQAF